MANPTNPITITATSAPGDSILSDSARGVSLWLPADATANVTVVVTHVDGETETTVLEVGGPGLAFKGKPPSKQIASITGYVASGSQTVYRAVNQP